MRQSIIADGDGEEINLSEGKSLVHRCPIIFLFSSKSATEMVRKKHILSTKQPVLEDSMLFAGARAIN